MDGQGLKQIANQMSLPVRSIKETVNSYDSPSSTLLAQNVAEILRIFIINLDQVKCYRRFLIIRNVIVDICKKKRHIHIIYKS